MTNVFNLLAEAAGVIDEPFHRPAVADVMLEAAHLGQKLQQAVRALLDDVNARHPEKPPREWSCPYMAELDKLVSPKEKKR